MVDELAEQWQSRFTPQMHIQRTADETAATPTTLAAKEKVMQQLLENKRLANSRRSSRP
ncbi:hypothetical protein RHM66_02580 [Pseudomonas sp. RTB3]|nr:hypothetical protein RHM66_02580 [Pseudomonas sp. RTB3]